jgi:D-amino peptidase
VLVTGDETTAAEMARFSPGVHAAVVKRSVSRFAADSLHPAAARALIRAEAEAAVAGLAAAPAVAAESPVRLEIAFRTSDYADLAARITGIERTGDLAASIVADDPLAVYTTFITAVLLCRGLSE